VLGVGDRAALGRIGLGGIFHDVGKSEIPQEVLRKKGPLTEEEWELVRRHPELGVEIVTRFQDVPSVVIQVVKSHHEQMEGGGYPDGCTADRLSRVARLAGIVDVYDALTSERPYGPARRPFEALSLMKEEMPGHFDLPLLHRFIRFLGPQDARSEGV
jgi:putative nucleotidyltransferase with HDIG domain